MEIDGSCHCGAIRYRAVIDPSRVRICHCTDCQKLSGTAFRVVVRVPEADFELLAGAPKVYIKTAESGRQRVQTFCGECGSPLYATSVGEGPKDFGLRLGTARQFAELVPSRQIWRRSAVPWLCQIDEMPARETE